MKDSENFSWIRRYRDPIATVDPVEYFEFYRELLVPFAAGETGRRHTAGQNISQARIAETLSHPGSRACTDTGCLRTSVRQYHYREIADHFEEMQELVPEERFEGFADFLKDKHSNRPAFLDELEKAGF